MATDFQSLEREALQSIQKAQTPDELIVLEKTFLGRKRGILTCEMRSLRALSPEGKRERGAALNAAKRTIQGALRERRSSFEQRHMETLVEEDALDVTMDLPEPERGHLHLIPEFIAQVEEVFGRMGFSVAYGPEIETEEMNFDLLNFPKDHPARDLQGTFWVREGKTPFGPSALRPFGPSTSLRPSLCELWPAGRAGSAQGELRAKGKRALRTHTSPVQIRYMREHKPPFRMICPGVVYRKDEDATHSPMFHQFEGLMVGKDVSLRHLKGVMVAAVKELLSPDLEFRFRASYFPFTEPSMEMDIRWRGDVAKSREGEWLEVAGCGMVHPAVFRNVNIDPKKWQGFAFGFGIERLLMIKHQIPDIRLFSMGDLRFLRQF